VDPTRQHPRPRAAACGVGSLLCHQGQEALPLPQRLRRAHAFPPPLKQPPTSVTHARARPMFDNRVLGLFEAFTSYFDHSRLTQRQPKSPSPEMPPLLWEITFWPKVERASPARNSDNEAGLYGPSQLRRHLCQRGPIISFPPARGDDLSGRTSKARPPRAAPTTPIPLTSSMGKGNSSCGAINRCTPWGLT